MIAFSLIASCIRGALLTYDRGHGGGGGGGGVHVLCFMLEHGYLYDTGTGAESFITILKNKNIRERLVPVSTKRL